MNSPADEFLFVLMSSLKLDTLDPESRIHATNESYSTINGHHKRIKVYEERARLQAPLTNEMEGDIQELVWRRLAYDKGRRDGERGDFLG